jgi:hypothetical protein
MEYEFYLVDENKTHQQTFSAWTMEATVRFVILRPFPSGPPTAVIHLQPGWSVVRCKEKVSSF